MNKLKAQEPQKIIRLNCFKRSSVYKFYSRDKNDKVVPLPLRDRINIWILTVQKGPGVDASVILLRITTLLAPTSRTVAFL